MTGGDQERLDAASLFVDVTSHLRTRQLGRVIEVHRIISSTNDRARELARTGALHGTTVLAHAQTRGRGQRGRTWHSPEGLGLYASFIIRPGPEIPPRRAPLLTLVAGLALRDGVIACSGVEPLIKWPNDLLAPKGALYGRKLAGILVEVSADPLRIDHAVIGFGVNLREGERPPELAHYATSLEALIASRGGEPERERLRHLDPARLLAEIAGALELRLDTAEGGSFRGIADAWNRHAAGRGQEVHVVVDGETVQGVLEGVAEDGALLLRTEKGSRALHRGELRLPGAPERPDAG